MRTVSTVSDWVTWRRGELFILDNPCLCTLWGYTGVPATGRVETVVSGTIDPMRIWATFFFS